MSQETLLQMMRDVNAAGYAVDAATRELGDVEWIIRSWESRGSNAESVDAYTYTCKDYAQALADLGPARRKWHAAKKEHTRLTRLLALYKNAEVEE